MTIRPIERAAHDARRRGVAMILVMIALVVGTVLAVSFLSQQTTATAVARNVSSHAEARAIAESALVLAVQRVRSGTDWRNELSNGVWASNVAFSGGTYTVTGVDGYDANGDGVIDGDETDGDLADDASDPVTVTVVATLAGVTHRVSATVWPTQVPLGPLTVLMVVADADALTASEDSRVELIESWGWTVRLISAGATAQAYEAAMTDAHVVYVPEDGGGNTAGARLAGAAVSVVFEDGDMMDELGLATAQGSAVGDTIRIVDNTHYVTSPFDIGDLVVAETNGRAEYPGGTIAAAARPLAWWPGNQSRVVAVVDAGATLADGSTAAGRRSVSPFAGFNADDLTDDGRMLLKRLMEWSAQSSMTQQTIEPITSWTQNTSITIPKGEDRLLVVTVGAETHSSITSISYGHQPLTIAGSAYESTGVGARTYVYYLREVGIKAASDKVLRVSWSGSADDVGYASRVYQYVSQTTPIRVTSTATNAGPSTIATAPMTVSNGDYVVGSAQVGHPNSYAWHSPLEMGVNDVNSSSAHTAGDYAVTDDPGTVAASATVNAPNRQALVGVVLQPRSQSSGTGVIPQTLALYEFKQTQPVAELMGRWTLDDDGSGGAIVLQRNLTMSNSAAIDGYHAQAGAYGGANRDEPVILITNTSSSGGIRLNNSARFVGSTYNRAGANPTTVVSLNNSAVITGNRYEQSVNFSMPSIGSPSGMPSSSGNLTVSGNTTVSADRRYGNLTINSNGNLRIDGDVRIWVAGNFDLNGGDVTLLNSNSRLTLYVGGACRVRGGGKLNNDTTRAAHVEVQHYSTGNDFTIESSSVVCGTVRTGRDLDMSNSSVIHGAVYVGRDLTMSNSAAIHIDLDLPAFHIVPVADETATNPALAHGGVTFDQGGAAGFTGRSLRFDGDDGFVLIPHHDDYLLHHGTIAFWFRPEGLSGARAILSKDSAGYDTGGQLHVYTNGSTLRARIQTDGSNPYGTGNEFEVSKSSIANNTWTHVTLTVGAGGLRLYVNGALADSVAYPGALATSSGGIGNYEPLVLGAGTHNSGDLTHLPLANHFTGRIDDMRIYREVLDAAQVARLHQGDPIGDRTEPSYVVLDTSGLGTPLDLFVEDTAAVAWLAEGGLTLNSGTVLRAPQPPGKLINGITATGEFSLEFIVQPTTVDANPRRLLWYGANSGNHANLDLRMQQLRHVARVRNQSTGSNPPDAEESGGLIANQTYHVLATFDGEMVRFYRDGSLTGEVEQPGHLLSWDDAYRFTLANAPAGTSPWLGTLKRVAVYDRAMNQRQTGNLVAGLPPGDGGSTTAGDGSVRWIEP